MVVDRRGQAAGHHRLALLEICGSLVMAVGGWQLKRLWRRVIVATRRKKLRHRAFCLALACLPVCPLLLPLVSIVDALLLVGITHIIERGKVAIGNPAQLIDAEPLEMLPTLVDHLIARVIT